MKSSAEFSALPGSRLLIPADVVSERGQRQMTHAERLCLEKYGHCPSLLKCSRLLCCVPSSSTEYLSGVGKPFGSAEYVESWDFRPS